MTKMAALSPARQVQKSMAASPLSPLRPAVFRFPTPSGWSHVKMPAEAPVELLTARPPVAVRLRVAQTCKRYLSTRGFIFMKEEATWQEKGAMETRPGAVRREERLLEPTCSAPPPGASAAACGTDEY